MSKNSSGVNIVSIYVFLLLTAMMEVCGSEDYIPTMIWTSREFQGRKNVDYLVMKKVKSDLFEAYLMEILGTVKPLIVIFLEEDLGTEDFEWRNESGDNSFPFLSKLTVNSRVDYFRSVESPHETVARLNKKGYRWKKLTPGTKPDFSGGDFLLVEFEKIKSGRPETLKSHDQQMEEVHRQLMDSKISWICIYTGRNLHEKDFFPDFKKISPWHVEKQFQKNSSRALSLYQDEYTGYTLITKGSLQLLLPSLKNLVPRYLENYLVASAKPFKNTMDFVIWFTNYTLTFHLNQLKGNWIIKEVKLLNGNGDTLNLKPRQDESRLKNKCYVELTEFQSEGKPMVKVIVSKYKFLKVQTHEEPCKKPYGFHLTVSFIVAIIISAVLLWRKLLENWDFSEKSKIVSVSISNEYFISSS